MVLKPGDKLGRYEIVASIGAGGMGEVYTARDTRLGRLVAIKTLPAGVTHDSNLRRRLLDEAQAASRLNHPHIVTLHDAGHENGADFLVMEYIRGETLDKLVPTGGMEPEQAVRYSIQIADALAAAHSAGIIHRDMKPANVMLSEEGNIKVLDFGLARMQEPPSSSGDCDATATQTGTVLGTAQYMSPEQVRGAKADERSDVFSFGATVYQLLTGRRPFDRGDRVLTLAAILQDQPAPIDSVPEKLQRIVLRCLEKDPERRFQRMADVKQELEAVQFVVPKPSRRKWLAAAACLLLVAAALGWYQLRGKFRVQSIVVLPFRNISGDATQDFLADGMTDGIISALSNVQSLRVISHTSAMRYKGTNKPASIVGRELGAEAVLEGSVLRSNNRIHIATQLVRADSNRQLWSQQYDRDVTDAVVLQSEVSRAIADEVRAEITPGEKAAIRSHAKTVDPAVYELYVKGRFLWNQRTPDALAKALKLFQQSVDRDPNYALAIAGLADTYVNLNYYIGTPTTETAPVATRLVNRALAIDPNLAEAWTTLAYIRYADEWDWQGADEAFRKAIGLKPGYAIAHHWRGEYLALVGRPAEAMREIDRAVSLDPLALFIQTGRSFVLRAGGRVDESIAQLEKTLELDPNYPQTHFHLGLSYQQKGMHHRAIDEFKKTISLSSPAPIYLAQLAYSEAAVGDTVEAHKLLNQLLTIAKTHGVASEVALVYWGLGDMDRGFEWAERAYRERSFWLPFLNVTATLQNVRRDPRSQDLLRRIGLQ